MISQSTPCHEYGLSISHSNFSRLSDFSANSFNATNSSPLNGYKELYFCFPSIAVPPFKLIELMHDAKPLFSLSIILLFAQYTVFRFVFVLISIPLKLLLPHLRVSRADAPFKFINEISFSAQFKSYKPDKLLTSSEVNLLKLQLSDCIFEHSPTDSILKLLSMQFK